jgi:ATP-dependent Clp protease ATP-binding subunit ClpB
LHYLGQKGFDPVFGARPLKRVIQSEVLNPLAKEIISGKLKAGDRVKISSSPAGPIVFETRAAEGV